jgi:hypothetical protein
MQSYPFEADKRVANGCPDTCNSGVPRLHAEWHERLSLRCISNPSCTMKYCTRCRPSKPSSCPNNYIYKPYHARKSASHWTATRWLGPQLRYNSSSRDPRSLMRSKFSPHLNVHTYSIPAARQEGSMSPSSVASRHSLLQPLRPFSSQRVGR